jgi:hypothetical protein
MKKIVLLAPAVVLAFGSWVSADTTVVVPVAAVAVDTPTHATPVAVPVATGLPVSDQRSQNVVSWKELNGNVRSVDRYNRAMVVQDNEGKDVQVLCSTRIHIYRSGNEISCADVEPNDSIRLQVNPVD